MVLFRSLPLVALIACSSVLVHCSQVSVNGTERSVQSLADKTQALLTELNADYKQLSVPFNYDSWEAYTKGTPESYKKMAEGEKALNEFLASPTKFKRIVEVQKEIKQNPSGATAIDRRQVDIYYFMFAGNQVDSDLLNKITDLSTKIQEEFNTFRVKIGDKEYSENDLRDILKKSNDSAKLKEAWEASKVVGERVEKDLKELVKLRNEKAKKLGFSNFHDMSLVMDEHSTKHLVDFFEALDKQTTENFRHAKAESDAKLATKFGVMVADLRPWHYQDPFYQTSPEVDPLSLDTLYEKADIKGLTGKFYSGIGLPIPGVIEKSDLYPRDKKSTHAFCFDLNREGDTRVLANITQSDRWMTTMLHEFGHSVYSATYIPHSLPFVTRDAAHTLTTEGLAMMFERETKRKGWLTKAGILPKDRQKQKQILETAKRQMRGRLLVFSRWAQVMFQFEKKMYENPEQDLNALWWDLVEKYQELKRPEGRHKPDYASKVHIVTAPVYYHNYLMGEIFASQVHHAMAKEVGKKTDPNEFFYADKKGIGAFVQKHILDLGKAYPWQEMVEKATGKPLNTDAFAYDTK